MKLVILSVLLTGVAAFAPVSDTGRMTSALRMSDAAPKSEKKEEVPCFGKTPLGGEPVFIGREFWNKWTSDIGSEATGTYFRASELKHGRSAMLAVLGFAFHKLGLTLNNISPHEYLSVTQNVKFADLAAMSPIDAIKSVPPEGLAQMFIFIAVIEIYELTHRDRKFIKGESVAPGLQAGGLTGDLGWNPLNIEITDRRRLSEIQNGRAAMFAISAWFANEAIAGSVPIPLPW